jgi:hypothetical protein
VSALSNDRSAQPIKVLSTAAFFAGEPEVLADRVRSVLAYDDGTIRVHDPLGGHYTICHSLSAEETARVMAVARHQREMHANAAVLAAGGE